MSHIINFVAEAAINRKRFVKAGTSSGKVLQATAGAEIFGASTDIDSASASRVDVQLDGVVPDLRLGGTVAFGDKLGADATGRAVKAVSGYFGAIALESGNEDELIPALIEKGQVVNASNVIIIPVDASAFAVAITSGESAAEVNIAGATIKVASAAAGKTVTFTVTAAAGHAIDAVKANGTTLTATGGVYSVVVTNSIIIDVTASAVGG